MGVELYWILANPAAFLQVAVPGIREAGFFVADGLGEAEEVVDAGGGLGGDVAEGVVL